MVIFQKHVSIDTPYSFNKKDVLKLLDQKNLWNRIIRIRQFGIRIYIEIDDIQIASKEIISYIK